MHGGAGGRTGRRERGHLLHVQEGEICNRITEVIT